VLFNDPVHCAGLLTEEWLSKCVLANHFPQVMALTPDRRQHLYYVMTYHEGATLAQKLDRGYRFSIAEVAQIGMRLAEGLSALHRLEIIHRDIKPANLHGGADGKLRILDLGVALNPALAHGRDMGNAGTPSFMAPELFAGEAPSVQSDVYAAGVTLYYLLTRRYPYGEIEPFQHPRFGEPLPPTRYRPDIPQWLENILLKAVARDKKNRLETAEELLVDLEHGALKPILRPPRTPLAERNPVLIWQSIAIISVIINLLMLYLSIVG
ncbi:MAG: serine/threonine protein kinase, partial [Burkholderiales bacterium]